MTITVEPYNGLAPHEATSDTSLAAAQSVQVILPSMESRVESYIESTRTWGATDDEIEVDLRMKHQTASARRRTLELKGVVVKTEERRRTRGGRRAAVYVHLTYAPQQTITEVAS